MADRNTNWDRGHDWERDDWQREEAWRRQRESEVGRERYREHSGESDRPEQRGPYTETGRRVGETQYENRRPFSTRGRNYGPSAFNPGGSNDLELFGTGQRGYGTTWGSSEVHTEGRDLYREPSRDYAEQGQHAGKGPKGYRRSDDRIREEVCECLTRHPGVDASEIDVQVKDGEVTLAGTVERREEKRMAEDAVERVAGVNDVHNQLRVAPNASGQISGNQQIQKVR